MAERIGLEAFVDTSKFKAGFAEYVSGMDKMILGTDRLSDVMDETAKPSVNLANKITDLGNRVLLQQRQLAIYTQELARLQSSSKTTTEQLQRKQLQVDRLSVSLDKNTRTLGTYRQQVEASQKGLQQFENEAKEAQQSLSLLDVTVGSFAGNTLSSAFQGAVSAGKDLLVGLTKEAFNAVAEHERLTLAIETLTARELLNSGEATNMADALGQASGRSQELLAWIEELAVKSPFTSDDIAATFKLAQAYGFTSDEAQRLTQVLTDFTAGTGQSGQVGERLALALGQISAKGKVSAQELNQLRETGLNVNEVLEGMGFNLNDVEKGLVKADNFIAAVVQTLERDFQGAAERQTESWAGLVSTLEDTKKIALREFFQGTFDAIQPLAADFVATLGSEEFKANLRAAGEELGNLVAAGVKLTQETDWDVISRALGRVKEDASALEPIFNPKEALEAAAKSYLFFSAGVAVIKETLSSGDLGVGLEAVLYGTGDAAEAARDAFFGLNEEVERLTGQRERKGISKDKGASPTFAPDTSPNVDYEKLADVAKDYQEAVSAGYQKIADASRDYAQKERELQTDLGKAYQDLNEGRQEAASELYVKLGEAEQDYAQLVTELGQERVQLDQDLNTSRLEAATEFNAERTQLEANFNQAVAEIGQQRAEAGTALNQGRIEAEAEALAAMTELEREHSEEVSDINRTLSREVEDYNREKLRSEEDFKRERDELEQEHADKVKDLIFDIRQAEDDAANARFDIERDLKDKLVDLEDKFKDRTKKARASIAEIEASLSGNAMVQVRNGRATLDSFLSKEDKKKLADLRQQIADEEAEREKARQDLESKAQEALDNEIERSSTRLANLQDKLTDENAAYDAAIADQQRKFDQQAEDRKLGYDRAVEDLTLRLQRENEEFDRQRGEIQGKLNDRLGDLQASYDASIAKLDQRLATERIKLDEQRAALQGKYSDELADLQKKHDEAIGKLQARFVKETAEYNAQRANLQSAYRQEVTDLEASYAEREIVVRKKLQDIAVANAEKQLELREQMEKTKDDFEEKIGKIAGAWSGQATDETKRYADYLAKFAGWLTQTEFPINFKINLPDFMIPGSPSPLEESLKRTEALLHGLNSMSPPALSTPMMSSPRMLAPPVAMSGPSFANSFGDIVLNGGMGGPQDIRNTARQGGLMVESELAGMLMEGARRQRGNYRSDFGERT